MKAVPKTNVKSTKKKPLSKHARRDASSSSSDSGSSDDSDVKARRRPRHIQRQPPPIAKPTTLMPQPTHHEKTLRAVFDKYDADADGVLSFSDLRKALASRQLRDVEIRQWLLEHDTSGHGHVSFADFVKHYATPTSGKASKPPASQVQRPSMPTTELYRPPPTGYESGSYRLGGTTGDVEQRRQLRRLFEAYDYDSDGKVSARDLRTFFCQQGRTDVDDDMIQEWILAKDRKQLGAVDLEDFLAAYEGTHRRANLG
ncbi:hypothetical protein SPRG_21272 [Saprolegnia parasitica CBS 223.65]|uniref:EF-hand domain-containing protein n=1 Tax=Saprolegnia parasitica (strain CBS 223.65) TaxID=695850 RepID=A0A067C479_SAPPC|nr:hypothetical protein SPRG_21272 [Saprolegnia parasitica CBS 223.65]KDO21597.1 hypothetical protein SPRG_21272 [Saprolegnia parasitica CBS 223.65]|eukprot:XP_012207706.1 hypothetical protein SPRG_21272 [Saprolegnia parasitica CBS 223.65]